MLELACGMMLFGPTLPAPLPNTAGDRAFASKGQRDAFGDPPNQQASDNFVVKWGDDGAVDVDDIADLLEAFETTWSVEVTTMGHVPPHGTDEYRFNVYIGDSGNGAPGSYGSGGYFNVDSEGYGHIVVSQDTLSIRDYRESTAAHEFYHALQYTADTYAYDGDSAWFWEATASWVSGEVFPDNETYASFLAGYAFHPEWPVEFFDYFDTGAFSEYHQYGAFIFPRYLSEHVRDWTLLRDAWVEAPGGSPLESIDLLLQAGEGIRVADIYPSFAARNANWDYRDRQIYVDLLDVWGQYYPDEDHRVVDTLDSGGDPDWRTPDEDNIPQNWGYNLILLEEPRNGSLFVEFESKNSRSVEWGVVVVQANDDESEYTPVPIDPDSQTGAIEIPEVGTEDNLFLVVTPMEGSDRSGVEYRYRMWIGEPQEDSGVPDDSGLADDDTEGPSDPLVGADPTAAGCGCEVPTAGGGPVSAGWACVMAVVLLARTRNASAR